MTSRASLPIHGVPALTTRDSQSTDLVEVDEKDYKSSHEEKITSTQPSQEYITPLTLRQRAKENLRASSKFVLEHVKHHVGPGVLASIAYFDP
ncbi:hypothetical protein FRC10_001606 [Ceratobasidium sp. 414]|nr:hypothetical protein FRC10_001606 [Ceratobasidium sp. 414]